VANDLRHPVSADDRLLVVDDDHGAVTAASKVHCGSDVGPAVSYSIEGCP
jgi:hypothetical protein